ncbi:hypothetical protein OIV83_003977 [Microbotryomycetes sp. JL201]|nr:hypothetical protein OIV83_003977 [Microbotryomycetes sp. JL201]
MFTARAQLSAACALLVSVNLAVAQVTPSAPGPNDVYREGQQCEAQWTPDTSGDWASFDIDLMSGSNLNMNQVTRVASGLDGTSSATTSITFDCPNVTPNSKIYFLQFSQDGKDPQWTTRFTIAAADGSTTTPANSTQPGGQAIPWGMGQLAENDGNPSSGSSTRSQSSATSSAASRSTQTSTATETDDESNSSMTIMSSESSSPSASADKTSTVTSMQTQGFSTASRSSSTDATTAPAARTSAPTSDASCLRLYGGASLAVALSVDWTSFAIDLMSGSNTQMTVVTRVADDMDGTSTTTTFTFACPQVTPNSAIYFLQFTQDGTDPQWTTRFTIAAADGSTTRPQYTTQPDGSAIPWGSGALADGTIASTVGAGGVTGTGPTTLSSTTTSRSTLSSTSTTSTTSSTSTLATTSSATISFASQASSRASATGSRSASSAASSASSKPKSAASSTGSGMFYETWPLAGKIGLLVGIIVAGLIVLGLLIWLIVRLCKRRSRHSDHKDALLGSSQSTARGLLGGGGGVGGGFGTRKNGRDDDAFDFRDDGDSMYKQPLASPPLHGGGVNDSTASFGRYADDFDEKYSPTHGIHDNGPYPVFGGGGPAQSMAAAGGVNRAGVGSRNAGSGHSPTNMYFNNIQNSHRPVESFQMVPTRSQSPAQSRQPLAPNGYTDLVPQIRVAAPPRFADDNASLNSTGTGTGSVNYDWSTSRDRQRGQADWLASKK